MGPDGERALAELAARLAATYPYSEPTYAGQMLKPPHPVAWAAYAATMLLNPNNHSLDGGPATSELEREAVAAIAAMVGFDDAARPPDLVGNGGEPRGALGRQGAPSRPRGRVGGERALHAPPPVRGDRRPPRDDSRGRARPARPRRARAASRRRRRRDGRGHRRDDVARSARRRRSRRRPVRRRTGRGCTSTPPTAASSRCSPTAASRRSTPGRSADRAGRFGRRRPAQARPAALRVRLRAVRGPRRRRLLPARLAVHLLQHPRITIRARPRSNARGRGRRRPRSGRPFARCR